MLCYINCLDIVPGGFPLVLALSVSATLGMIVIIFIMMFSSLLCVYRLKGKCCILI